MRRSFPCVVRSATALALLVFGVAGRAAAGPLNPLDFTSLGAFPSAPGTYTYSLSGTTPTLSGPGGTLTGVLYSDAPGHQIAVFDFSSINLGSNQSLAFVPIITSPPFPPFPLQAPPLALLSQGDVTINGSIEVSGSAFPATGPPPQPAPGDSSGARASGAGALSFPPAAPAAVARESWGRIASQ